MGRTLQTGWGWAVVLVWTTVMTWSSVSVADSERYAVLVANNYGGGERETLRYAENDAKRMTRVLSELGLFRHERMRILLGANPSQFLGAIGRLAEKISENDSSSQSLFLVYFSGHSDGRSLFMGSDRLGISELKQALTPCAADVVLLILDACNAGAAIQGKGGRSAPSFVRFEDSSRTKGRIILTSTSASQPSQESDDLGSSFFTHYLVSGMMGDADQSGDGRVTLSELYSYAHDHTINRTMDTMPGVQRPSFYYDLKGEGSIVLTDINSGSSGIILPRDSQGTYLLFDRDRRIVVAEVHKLDGQARMIPLSPGSYTIKKRLSEHLLLADVAVKRDRRTIIADNQMRSMEYEHKTSKGWDLDLRNTMTDWEAGPWFSWTVFSRAPAGGIWSYPAGGIALSYRDWPARKWAVRLGFSAGGWNSSLPAEDGRIPYKLLQLGSDFSLGRRYWYGPLVAEIGGRLSLCFLQRRFSIDDSVYITDQAMGGGMGPYVVTSIRLGAIRLALDISSGMLWFPKADSSFIPYLATGVVMSLGID